MASTGKILRQVISTDKIPRPSYPYRAVFGGVELHQAVKVGPTLYISGIVGLDPVTSELCGSDIEAQTGQVLKNMRCVLEEAGMSLNNVVKTTVLLTDLQEFSKANEVYASFFKPPLPARAAYQVVQLPKSAKIEIEAIAVDCEDVE